MENAHLKINVIQRIQKIFVLFYILLKIQIAHIKLFTFNKKTVQNKFLFPAEYIDQIHKILLFKMDKDSFIACLGWFRSKTGIIKKYFNEVNDKYHKEKELKFENPFDKEIIEK